MAYLDILFVHRDADGPSAQQRLDEITSATLAAKIELTVIPVVPVQELEAWLLADPAAIRAVVGKQNVAAPVPVPPLGSNRVDEESQGDARAGTSRRR